MGPQGLQTGGTGRGPRTAAGEGWVSESRPERTSERADSGSCSVATRWPGRGGPSRAGSTVCAWPSPPRRGPSGASRCEGRGWALTPVPPRPIPPAGRGDRPPGVARCRARHATRRCRGPRSPCPSRRPGHGRCARRGFRPRRPGRGSAPRCVRRSRRCRSSSSSHSPVWMPARISIPNVSASARKASAQRMACVGPSNVMRWPSPVLCTTVPPNRSRELGGDLIETGAAPHATARRRSPRRVASRRRCR